MTDTKDHPWPVKQAVERAGQEAGFTGHVGEQPTDPELLECWRRGYGRGLRDRGVGRTAF